VFRGYKAAREATRGDFDQGLPPNFGVMEPSTNAPIRDSSLAVSVHLKDSLPPPALIQQPNSGLAWGLGECESDGLTRMTVGRRMTHSEGRVLNCDTCGSVMDMVDDSR
jgi:hypothetical protein